MGLRTIRPGSIHPLDAQHAALIVGEIDVDAQAHPGRAGTDFVLLLDLVTGHWVQPLQVDGGLDLELVDGRHVRAEGEQHASRAIFADVLHRREWVRLGERSRY